MNTNNKIRKTDEQNKSSLNNLCDNKSNIYTLIGIIISFIIIYKLMDLAPRIQKNIFKSENSILFQNGHGIFGPKIGIFILYIGLLALFLLFKIIKYRKTKLIESGKTNDFNFILYYLILVSIVAIPVGIISFFNFQEYTTNRIKTNSIFKPNIQTTYNGLKRQRLFIKDASKNTIFYEFILENGEYVSLPFNSANKESVHRIDKMINSDREIVITKSLMLEVIKQGLYTEEEARNIYNQPTIDLKEDNSPK